MKRVFMEQLLSLLNLAAVKTKSALSHKSTAAAARDSVEEKFRSALDTALLDVGQDQKNIGELSAKAVVTHRSAKERLGVEQEVKELKNLKDIRDILILSQEKKLGLKSLTVEIKKEGEQAKRLVFKGSDDAVQNDVKATRTLQPAAVRTAALSTPEVTEANTVKIDLKDLLARAKGENSETLHETQETKSHQKAPSDLSSGSKGTVQKNTLETVDEKHLLKTDAKRLQSETDSKRPVKEEKTLGATNGSSELPPTEKRARPKTVRYEETPSQKSPAADLKKDTHTEKTDQKDATPTQKAERPALRQSKTDTPPPAPKSDSPAAKTVPGESQNVTPVPADQKKDPLPEPALVKEETPPVDPKEEKIPANEKSKHAAKTLKTDTLRPDDVIKTPRSTPSDDAPKETVAKQAADTLEKSATEAPEKMETVKEVPAEIQKRPKTPAAADRPTESRKETLPLADMPKTSGIESIRKTSETPPKADLAGLIHAKPAKMPQSPLPQKETTPQKPVSKAQEPISTPAASSSQMRENEPALTAVKAEPEKEEPRELPKTHAKRHAKHTPATAIDTKQPTVQEAAVEAPKPQSRPDEEAGRQRETETNVVQQQKNTKNPTLGSLLLASSGDTKKSAKERSDTKNPVESKQGGDPLKTGTPDDEESVNRDFISKILSRNLSAGAAMTMENAPAAQTGSATLPSAAETSEVNTLPGENSTQELQPELLKNEEVRSDNLKNRIASAKATIGHFTRDLKEQVKEYKSPIMKISMDLNPKNLGSVGVTLINRGKNLHVQIHSNPQAIQLFMQNNLDFKNALGDLGYKDVQLNFSFGGGSSSNHSGGGYREQETPSYFGSRSDTNSEADEMEIILPEIIYG